MIKVMIKKISKDAFIPKMQTDGASGYDLYSCENQIIKSKDLGLISTGISIALDKGYEAQVRPRSGLALKNKVTVLNTPGTIDSDYRGEIKVILINFGEQDFIVKKGDRIAQLVFQKVEEVDFIETEFLDTTKRGDGGFGSSGK